MLLVTVRYYGIRELCDCFIESLIEWTHDCWVAGSSEVANSMLIRILFSVRDSPFTCNWEI